MILFILLTNIEVGMKSWFTYKVGVVVAAVAALLAVSCTQSDFDMPTIEDGQSIDVTFIPSFDNGARVTRVGDASQIDKLYVEVYFEEYKVGERLAYNVTDGVIENFSISLLNSQRYTIVFWAQSSRCEAYNTDDLANITIDYTKHNSLSEIELRDAFYSAISFTVTPQTARQRVKLYRPFALLAVGTESSNYNNAIPNQSCKIKIENVPTSFNIFSGTSSNSAAIEMNFAVDGSAVPEKDGYTLLGISYLLPFTEQRATITTTVGAEQKQTDITLSELAANKRYSILGSALLPE